MADGNALGPQPDFNLVAGEFLKIPNIPAVANGQLILDELRAIRDQVTRFETAVLQDFTQLRQEVRQDVAQLRQDFEQLRQEVRQDVANLRQEVRQDVANLRQDLVTMITASNQNNAARVQNTYLENRASDLSPFVNSISGAAIPDFPTTSTELEQMTRRRLERILEQLGLQITAGGNVADMKRKLRAHIGLREVAVQPA
ncbi:hypothetical protein RBB50_011468 [Rhinocladiella similis]